MPTLLEGSVCNSDGPVGTITTLARSEAQAHFSQLLFSDPIDLAGVAAEVRSQPGLEGLVMRLSASLALSTDGPPATLEEAVVVLGTKRLWILIDLWSSSEHNSADQNMALSESVGHGADHPAPSNTLEARYISSFLRSVRPMGQEPEGLTPAPWNSKMSPDQIFAFADLFMRDFFSLLPAIHPIVDDPGASSGQLT